jgi:glycosyltransferase involved in cell wall biosynthesis
VVPNGVSSAFYNPSKSRNAPSEFSLGFVGRLSSVKNVDLFLELNTFLDNPAKLKIITDIYAGANKPIGQSLLKKMTAGEVHYFHPRPTADLADFYREELSVNIVPSLFETFCNVATESLVTGTPVALSDRAGSKDIFKKYGLEDLIFSIEDTDSLKASLEAAKEMDYTVPKNISKEIYNELKWENVIDEYNSLSEKVANK